jgi:hypothetical protein
MGWVVSGKGRRIKLDIGPTNFKAISEMRPYTRIYRHCLWNANSIITVSLEFPKSFQAKSKQIASNRVLWKLLVTQRRNASFLLWKKKFHFRAHKRGRHLNLFCARAFQSHITQYSLILPRSPCISVTHNTVLLYPTTLPGSVHCVSLSNSVQ